MGGSQYTINPRQNEEIYHLINSRIVSWSEGNMRKYPWRETRDPYKILIAELMLHRTKADQVNKIYKNFILKYPDPRHIVNAGRKNIEKELSSLGLRWRSRLIFEMAETVVSEYGGMIPLKKEDLLSLPGIGEYIASAVLCFTETMNEPLLDTNTIRVIGRILGLPIGETSRRSSKFRKEMEKIMKYGNARIFSMSLIDFASILCKPSKPSCGICIFKDICTYYIKEENR